MNFDRLPKYTCPLIDKVIEAVEGDLEDLSVNYVVGLMEEIREANNKLRNAAEEARDQCEVLEYERDNAQAEAGRLMAELEELRRNSKILAGLA